MLAFARIHPRETARVYLNFSDREVPLDMRDAPGVRLRSNLRDAPESATGRRLLAPWEAVVIFDTAELVT